MNIMVVFLMPVARELFSFTNIRLIHFLLLSEGSPLYPVHLNFLTISDVNYVLFITLTIKNLVDNYHPRLGTKSDQ